MGELGIYIDRGNLIQQHGPKGEKGENIKSKHS